MLDRQVGNRYFVTASNAAKAVFLKEAAVEFLKFTGRDKGNKLERDVYLKLHDCNGLAALKADGLMFYHVYADIVILAKSCELKKSALDMNIHYVELKEFLCVLETQPETILDKNYEVFKSEKRLYGDEKKVNHRCHEKSKCVHKQLFVSDTWDKHLLYPIIANGAATMKTKLCSYAQHQLPGGVYYNPEPAMKEVLADVSPSNDLCESILGLNDYLSSVLPNMHQVTRSNLVQLKKNKTIEWLQELPKPQQDDIVDLAIVSRKEALKCRKEDDDKVHKKRKENMLQAHSRQQTLKQKEKLEKHALLKEHLITSSEELYQSLTDVDAEVSVERERKAKKLALLKLQVKMRKKLLKQDIRIFFSRSGKQRPLDDIVQEIGRFIDSSTTSLEFANGFLLVGKRINHRFELEDTHVDKWYRGTVVEYDPVSKLHTIRYDSEKDECQFDITVDIILGDLVVINE